MFYWRRHETSDWDHKFIMKVFTELINQLRSFFTILPLFLTEPKLPPPSGHYRMQVDVTSAFASLVSLRLLLGHNSYITHNATRRLERPCLWSFWACGWNISRLYFKMDVAIIMMCKCFRLACPGRSAPSFFFLFFYLMKSPNDVEAVVLLSDCLLSSQYVVCIDALPLALLKIVIVLWSHA